MKVSVVMAGRNSDVNLLRMAIKSILNQTFQDFEFIFVDDGSQQPLEPMVRAISSDKRIRVFRIAPSGLGAALNHGISQSSGEYIARIDDDDYSYPTRLERQVDYLDHHPEVSCVGTNIYYKVGSKIYPHTPFPTDHDAIVDRLVNLHFAMAHTSLMYRRTSFDQIGGYRIPGGGQDLDLLLQMGLAGRLSNLEDYLVCYSLFASGLSVVNTKKKEAYLFALRAAMESEAYSPFYAAIQSTIISLNQSSQNKWFVNIGLLKRKLLLLMVKLRGKPFSIG